MASYASEQKLKSFTKKIETGKSINSNYLVTKYVKDFSWIEGTGA